MLSDRAPQSVHPPGTAPECRARHLVIMLAAVDELPDADRLAIQRAISDQLRAALTRTGPLAWVPMRYNVEIVNAISLRLGRRRAREFFNGFQLRAFDASLMRAFVQGALRLTARDPGTAMRWVPAGYDLVFRNVGAWEAPEVTSDAVMLTIGHLPRMCLEGSAWPESLASSLHAVLGLLERRGDVEVVAQDVRSRTARFRVTWEPD